MTEPTDHELLADYARTGSESAFAQLVARRINLVHSAARRFTSNDLQAEEITQTPHQKDSKQLGCQMVQSAS
jgi:hypothetical protein